MVVAVWEVLGHVVVLAGAKKPPASILFGMYPFKQSLQDNKLSTH